MKHLRRKFTVMLCWSVSVGMIANVWSADLSFRKHVINADSKFEAALIPVRHLVADDEPWCAFLILKRNAVVAAIGDAVAPHAHVRVAVVGLNAVIGRVENVIAEYVYVSVRVRDSIGCVGNAVMGNRVVACLTKLDALAT